MPPSLLLIILEGAAVHVKYDNNEVKIVIELINNYFLNYKHIFFLWMLLRLFILCLEQVLLTFILG